MFQNKLSQPLVMAYLHKNILNRKLKWAVCLALTVLIFTCGIPLPIFESHMAGLIILGAFLTGFFLICAILTARTAGEALESRSEDDSRAVVAVGVFVMVLCAFLYFAVYDTRMSAELKDGTIVQGVIVSVTSEESRSRRSARTTSSYTATVTFTTNEGKSITTSKSINHDEYNTLIHGQAIDLVYSKRTPQIIELLSNEKSIRTYVGTQDRIIGLKDLLALTDIPNSKAGDFLNSISYKWTYNEDGGRWENTKRHASIHLEDGVGVIYRMSMVEREVFDSELKDMGFSKDSVDESDKEVKVKFKSEKFFVTVSHERTGSPLEYPMGINFFKIINVTKRENREASK